MRNVALACALALLPGVALAAEPGEVPEAAIVGRDPNPPYMSSKKLVELNRADQNVIRSGPGETFSVIEVADKGSRYEVLAKRGEWYNVRLSDVRTGWVHASLCREMTDMSGLEFRPNPRMFSRIGSFALTGYAGGYSFDRKSNSFAAGGRVGYYLFDYLEVEGGVSWTRVNRPAEIVESLFDLTLEAEQFHMLFYEMNANLKLLPGRQLVPYLSAGGGAQIMQGETEPGWNWGGGINFFVQKHTAVRWEFRNYRFDSGNDQSRRQNNNYTFTVGTTFLL
ncbi:MAG: outer membrane beta-barrel domain-containing protein [bacterium]